MIETKPTILVVEDREDWQDLLRTILAGENYDVDVASSAPEALSALEKRHYHLAVLDLSLVEGDPQNTEGMTILESIAKGQDNTRAIMLTGYATVPRAVEAFHQHRAFDFLEKQNFDSEKFRALVLQALEGALAADQAGRSLASLVPGMTLDKLASMISVHGHRMQGRREKKELKDELNALITKLLEGLLPLLPHPQGIQLVQNQNDGVVGVEMRYWSRRLGKPILVWLGDRGHFNEAMKPLIRKVPTPNLLGAVYRDNLPYEEFVQKDQNLNELNLTQAPAKEAGGWAGEGES